MSSSPSAATKLSPEAHHRLAILALSKAEPMSHLAAREGVSRPFLYRQKRKALNAVEAAYAANDANAAVNAAAKLDLLKIIDEAMKGD